MMGLRILKCFRLVNYRFIEKETYVSYQVSPIDRHGRRAL